MREIKFRAWDRKRKEMFQVHQMEYSRIDHSLNNVVGYTDAGGSWWDQHGGGNSMYANEFRYILMQYTGLKDKNGKEIYEGDVVKQTYHMEQRDEHGDHEWISFDGHHIGPVVITARGICLKNPLHYSMETDETNPMNAYKQVAGYRSEVIGNIYENPELLEEVPHDAAQ